MYVATKLTDNDYEGLRYLVQERTGLVFGPRRREALARGVLSAASKLGIDEVAEYRQVLEGATTDSDLWDDLISAITVGETYFFRDPAQFEALRQSILPDIIGRHRQDRRIRIWSAGCATGEEPYSIAILLRQLLPELASWQVHILATDINKRALRRGREGRYKEWSLRQTDPLTRKSYFQARGGVFELIPQVKQMVTFAYLNLVEDVYPSLATNTNAMDLILCRNVSIYLPEQTTRQIADRFRRCPVSGGWLIVGAAESRNDIYNGFAAHSFAGACAYQKAPERSEWAVVPDQQPAGPPAPVRFPQVQAAAGPAADHVPGMRAEPPLAQQPAAVAAPAAQRRAPVAPDSASPEPSSCREAYDRGLALMGSGRYEEAAACFSSCLEREPGFAPACYHMARACANRGRLEEAQAWCETTIGRDPLMVAAHYTLALIHQEQGAVEQAIAQLKRTLYVDSGFVLAYFSLAGLYLQIGRRAEATLCRMQAARLASRMSPQDVLPWSDGMTACELLTMLAPV